MKELVFGLVIGAAAPIIVGILFSIAGMVYSILFKERAGEVMRPHQFYLYFLFISIVFIFVFLNAINTGIINKFLKIPSSLYFLILPMSVVLGIGLFYMEFYLTLFFRKLAKYIHFIKEKEILIKGDKSSFEEKYKPSILVILSILISFFEEFIWRGFLIIGFSEGLGMPLWGAIILSSLLFGIHHFYFGLESIFAKFFSALILAGLFILSFNIIFPFIAHFVFNMWVFKKEK